MKVSYSWLTEYIGKNAPSAEEIEQLLTFHAFEIEGVEKVGDDTVIDVDVLPNRSSDCLSHRGVAREVASITGQSLEHDPLVKTPNLTNTDDINVNITDPKACPRFTVSLITGVEVKESPKWLQDRLAAIGQRPINNLVDATNYVMFALGQPLHAYDADSFPKSDGKWQFGVRLAKAGETVSLIAEGGKDEERVVELDGSELLIVDESSNQPVGLAGVKGGQFAGVHAGTKNILLEAAHFDPTLTRKTARKLGIVIDASKRFENEPSRELPPYAQQAVIDLIKDIAGGEYQGTVDEYLEKKLNPTVMVSVSRTNALLGLSLEANAVKEILGRIGCQVKTDEKDLEVVGPWERTDLNIEEDFIEEVGRVYGYEHIDSVAPSAAPLAEVNTRHYYSEQIRDQLLSLGFSEVITSSFRKKDQIQLKNALASDKSYLRSSLTQNIAEALDKNASLADLLGISDTRVFEIGTVFQNGEGGLTEHVSLCLGVRLKPSGYSGKEDKLLKDILAELAKSLNTPIDWSIEKGVAEANFSELLAKLPEATAYEPVPPASEVKYQSFSLYPFVSRDIALWVSDSPGEDLKKEVVEVLNNAAGELRVRTTLFDEFTKDGRTSYAFRLIFQSKEKTLTDEEVNQMMDRVYEAAKARNWEVR